MPERDGGPGVRVLLFGATGFLGTHIRDAFARDGRTASLAGLAYEVPPGEPTLRAVDLVAASPRQIDGFVAEARPDVIVNAAGLTAGSNDALRALNVTFVERLLGAMARQAPGARLVHLGSAAEYAPTTARRPTHERDEARPSGPYGETKLAATRLVHGAARAGLDTVVLRVFNPIGAGMDRRTLPGTAVHRLAAALAAGERVVRFGPLGAHRDFVAATDVAAAVMAAAHHPRAGGEILNVGTGRARQVRELVHELAGVAGFTGAIEEDGGPGSSRSGTVAWTAAGIDRARHVLGWYPTVTFERAVEALWRGSLAASMPTVGATCAPAASPAAGS